VITDLIFYAAAIPAVILVGLAKGGFAGLGALSLPMIALVISPVRAAAIMLPLLIVQDAVSVWAYWKKWDWGNLSVLFPGAVIGILLGYLLAAEVSEGAFTLALGVISLGFALRQLLRPRPTTGRPSKITGWFWGAAAGFTSMIANAGGPPFQIYVMPQMLPRDVFVGTGVLFFAVVNLAKLLPFFMLGQFTPQNLATSAALLPVAILSTWAGVLLVRRIRSDRFYTLVYILLVLVGLKLSWDGSAELFL